MIDKYKYQTVEDLLLDEAFQHSVLSPTNENKEYWEILIASGSLQKEIYEEAQQLILSVRSAAHTEVEDENMDKLWQQIDSTNRRVTTRKRLYIISAVASVACVFLVAFLFNFNSPIQSDSQIAELANQDLENLKNQNQIQLLRPNDKVDIAEDNIVVDYSQDGKVIIDKDVLDADTIGYNQLIVPYGKRSSLILEDGTKLWVNAGTHVIYPSRFEKNKREIFVNGEVYADVAKDENRPFHIKSKVLDLKVLGTQFNFNSHDLDELQSVVLVSGSVEISSLKQKNKSILKPNHEFLLSEGVQSIREVDVTDYISWTKGYYTFKHKPMGDIAQYLTKYYGVNVSCDNEVRVILLTGGIDLKDDINSVLQGLKFASNIDYIKNENTYQLFKEHTDN